MVEVQQSLPWGAMFTALSLIAIIVTGVANLLWSGKYQAASNKEIAAMDAHIKALKDQLEMLNIYNPKKIREMHAAEIDNLMEIIDKVQNEKAELEKEIDKVKSNHSDASRSTEAAETRNAKTEQRLDTLIKAIDEKTAEINFLHGYSTSLRRLSWGSGEWPTLQTVRNSMSEYSLEELIRELKIMSEKEFSLSMAHTESKGPNSQEDD